MEPFDSFEEPLRGTITPYYYKPQGEWKKGSTLRGPKRALRLCMLCIVFPGLLLGVPLYLKHHVFAYQTYPVGMSDMRLIDGKVSTTWCQKQIIRVNNTTFNAFVLPHVPNVSKDRTVVGMVRELVLSDDMKEYWGFYLLKGSTVTVSTCVRWPGASMILIRGHRHLHECAYIGDDSSEELDELLELAETQGITGLQYSSPEGTPNRVEALRKRRPGVEFHDPHLQAENNTFTPKDRETDRDSEDDISGKRMKELLNLLPHRAKQSKLKTPSNHMPNADRRKITNFQDQLYSEIEKLKKDNPKNITLIAGMTIDEIRKRMQADHVHKVRETNIGNHETENIHFAKKKEEAVQSRQTNNNKNNSTVTSDKQQIDNNNSTSNDSSVEDVLKKIYNLNPDKRNRLMNFLKKNSTLKQEGSDGDGIMTATSGEDVETKTEKPKKPKASDGKSIEDEVEILEIDKPANMGTPQRKRKNKTSTMPTPARNETREEKLLRLKREFVLQNQLTSEAEESENLAAEQGYVPDGIADHHERLNQTTLNDRSNSEFWSSFSSSEEALLNCDGLILSLPLSPNSRCKTTSNDEQFMNASQSNKITYTVPVNGYYFFVFNSENEVQENFIRVKFEIQKTVYNVSNSIESCNNAKDECKLPLHFFSNEKVVFELPLRNNETLWNEEYIVHSECEPRTAIYLICVISVPLMILLFAFQ